MIKRVLKKLKRDGPTAFMVALIKYPFQLSYRLKYKKMLAVKNLQDKFSYIYDNKIWLVNEVLSGEGSEIEYTKTLREWLISNMSRLNVSIFVDAPCGDFNWMKCVLPSLSLNYIGLDIVPSVIKKNEETYSSKNIRFEIADICKNKLPSCDLIMVRDCLFHLSFEDIDNFLSNLAKTEYKYLLTTTHTVEEEYINQNITSGDCRAINLFSKPFNFNERKVLEYINDYPKENPSLRKMILIEKKHVPVKLELK